MNIEAKKENILLDLHTEFSKLPIHFRERICEECSYSVPTFYRKIREHDKLIDGKLMQALSKAEREMIRGIAEELVDNLFSTVFGNNDK